MLKRLFIKLGILLLSLNFTLTLAQDYEKLSNEICNSILKNDKFSEDNLLKEFEKHYDVKNEKNELLISDFNVFSFKLQKAIIKNCSKNLPFLETYSFFPLTNISDVEQVFNNEQTKELEKLLTKIQDKKRLQVLVVTTEDYYPKENIKDYSFLILNDNYNNLFAKGAILFVINLKERNIRISTNTIAQKVLSDEFCKNLIDKIIIPNFQNGKYFEGIKEAILKIETKI